MEDIKKTRPTHRWTVAHMNLETVVASTHKASADPGLTGVSALREVTEANKHLYCKHYLQLIKTTNKSQVNFLQ